MGHGSPPPGEDTVTRPAGWEHLSVAISGPILNCGHFRSHTLMTRRKGATPQKGHGLCPTLGHLAPAHHKPWKLGLGILGTEPNISLFKLRHLLYASVSPLPVISQVGPPGLVSGSTWPKVTSSHNIPYPAIVWAAGPQRLLGSMCASPRQKDLF